MPVSQEALDELALSQAEYEAIVERLGREPNSLELGLFGSLWSEHCGYKHSKPLLRMFEARSDRLLVAPGSENAGVVAIGDGWAVVMKVESHNHPSAIEPYEGAATGVGGIVRDIFAMGARPIALLNSLRFGPLSEARSRYLFEGVVSGISGYGNCIGVPDVGGEVYFSESYSGNPLVNAMCVGLLRTDELRRATAGDPGNLLMLVGADTGRDGIHGASGLASRTFEDERELRPTVQVGNPFLEKVLIEACLEAATSDAVVGIQDLGAAGLTSASVECASNAGAGLSIDVAKAPRRESGMEPYEVMLSESQERMLIVVKPGREREVAQIFDKWDLRSDVIGEVTDDGLATILDKGQERGSVPVRLLTDPPLYRGDQNARPL
ncbi:MAG: phosphoribosylformylglycinamidine synthase subunit PurL, partial [Dehalococcoidia bacterium]|nr:phosphoribosylformylglycinamidine synthase subunit PurL [Dehalococcoidia bacterium]